MRTRVVHCRRERYDVYVGRPSPWGNPFVIGRDGTREEVVAKYAGVGSHTAPSSGENNGVARKDVGMLVCAAAVPCRRQGETRRCLRLIPPSSPFFLSLI